MARSDEAKMIVSLEARLTQFERSFDRAQKVAARGYGQITAGSSRMASKIEQDFTRTSRAAARLGQEITVFKSSLLGSFGAGFAGGAAAGFIAELPGAIRNATRSIAEMKAEAARAGVAVAPFQELAFAAQQSKIPLDALTDGMKELQLRADEFLSTGKGPAAEAFTRLGYGAEELGERLKDPIGLFDDVIRRLKAFDKAAQIRILDEVFGGTGGERLVTLLDEGARSLEEMRGRARELGVVLSDDVVNKAAELDARFNEVAATIDSRVKTALVGAADVVAEIADRIADLDASLNALGNASFWTSLRQFMGVSDQEAATGNLRFQLMQRRNGLAPPVPDFYDVRQNAVGVPQATPTEVTVTADKLSGLADTFEVALRQMIADARAAGHEISVSSGLRTRAQQQALWEEAIRKYGSPAAARKWVAPPGSSRHESGMAADLRFGGAGAQAWAHQNAGAYGLNFPMGWEPWHVEPGGARGGVAATSREAATALQESSAAARQQAEAYYEAVDAAKKLAEAQQEAATKTAEAYTSIAKDAVGGLISDLRNGVSAADAMANALDRVADRLIDMALDAVFSPSAFAGLFGGGGAPLNLLPKAGGGPVRRGGAYLVGERRPELFIPNTAGTIVPNPRAMPAGGGRGGGGDVVLNITNTTGQPVEKTGERMTDLGKMIDLRVGDAIQSGRLDKPMAGRFGARPVTTRRGK